VRFVTISLSDPCRFQNRRIPFVRSDHTIEFFQIAILLTGTLSSLISMLRV
jgi:hypothetical protein